jgi:predicted TIM-barrel fold metal-dependent hydrolase
MTITDGVKIISADDHVQEPADLWETRLPKALRDRAPKVVRLPDGGDAWSVPGYPPRPFGILIAAGTGRNDKATGLTWEDCPRGAYDPDARLKDMDLDGIHASVLYPNVCLDFFMCQVELPPDLFGPVCRAYNDFLSEFCTTNLGRLAGVGLVPLYDLGEAKAEMEHIARLPGMKGVLFPVKPPVDDWNDLAYEPIWAAAADLDLIIHIHTGKPRGLPNKLEMQEQNCGIQIYYQLGRVSMIETFGYIFWSGVLERHPQLKFVSVEGSIGWLPYFKEGGAALMKKHQRWTGDQLQYPPGHWFGKNFFATFEEDRLGVELRHHTGIDTLLWASDYPHSQTTWPESAKAIEETFEGVPADEVRQIVSENASRLYGFD